MINCFLNQTSKNLLTKKDVKSLRNVIFKSKYHGLHISALDGLEKLLSNIDYMMLINDILEKNIYPDVVKEAKAKVLLMAKNDFSSFMKTFYELSSILKCYMVLIQYLRINETKLKRNLIKEAIQNMIL